MSVGPEFRKDADALSFILWQGRALPSLAKLNAAAQLWISRVDADARQLSNGEGIKIYNGWGEVGAKAHVTDDLPPGAVWFAMDGSSSINSHLAMRF